jgi:hypothetical protein
MRYYPNFTEFILNDPTIHLSLNNVTPAGAYFGRDQEVLKKRRMDFILK